MYIGVVVEVIERKGVVFVVIDFVFSLGLVIDFFIVIF